MLRTWILTFFTALALTATSADAKKITRTVVVDETFAEFGFNWDSSGGMYMRFRPFNVDGQLEICAVYLDEQGPGWLKRANLNIVVLKKAAFVIDGKTMMRNLSFADTVSSDLKESKLIGQRANCVATRKPFPANQFQYGIKVRDGRYQEDG